MTDVVEGSGVEPPSAGGVLRITAEDLGIQQGYAELILLALSVPCLKLLFGMNQSQYGAVCFREGVCKVNG
jgi:hypothetical protein